MRFPRAGTLLIFVITASFYLFFLESDSRAQDIPPFNTLSSSETKQPFDQKVTQKPQHLVVRLKSNHTPLIAGKSGTIAFEIEIVPSSESLNAGLDWNLNAPTPVILWVSSSEASGIHFVDKKNPNHTFQQILVKYDLSEKEKSGGVFSVQLAYTVSPRTKAGDHSFRVNIFGELILPDGRKIHDMGVLTVPFEVDTHLWTKLLMLFVVAFVIFLFIIEWVRIDVVAILMMVVLPELGLLDARDAFKGLSSNAVVAIIGVMIISYGLNRVGLVSRIIQPLLGIVGNSSSRLVIIFSSVIALISSVMQNTGAAVLFLPAIRIVTSRTLKIPISQVLMPIGMAAILGGTLTMVGTSPLILLNDILPSGIKKFGFLELTPIAIAIVIGGIVYLGIFGIPILKKLSKHRTAEGGAAVDHSDGGISELYPSLQGPFEIYISSDYILTNNPQKIGMIRRAFLVNIVAISTSNDIQGIAPAPDTPIQPGITVCAYGTYDAVLNFASVYGLSLKEKPFLFQHSLFNPAIAGIVEVIIPPRSKLIGQTIKEIRFRETFGVSVLAVQNDGTTYYEELADRPLHVGDAIVTHGMWEQFNYLKNSYHNFIIISFFEKEFQRPEKATWAALSFLVALIMMLISSFYFQHQPYNPIPLSVCLMVGALGMVISKTISIGEAYNAVDWRTVFLLSGLIPLGMAMDQTGTAQWIARGIVALLGSAITPFMLLAILALLSCGFTMVISNVGACALLVPLGISMANQIGVDPRVAAIIVGIGVSNSFILPTHQVNALYMGPGEYRTKDYIKIGGFLSLLYMVILVLMTYFIYL